jgi:hypothetical protein
MSLDTLKEDLKLNLAELAKMTPELTTPAEIVNHLKDTLWPTIEALVDELAEVDDCVADMIQGAEDILQPETAAVFTAIVAASKVVAEGLKTRMAAANENNPPLAKVISELEKNLAEGEALLREIVIDDGESFEDDEGEDGDDEDDDEEEDA